MEKLMPITFPIVSNLIEVDFKTLNFERAEETYLKFENLMKESSDSILIMIKGFSKSLQIDKVLKYYEMIPDKRISSSYHLNILIECLTKSNMLDQALNLFEIHKDSTVDLSTFIILAKYYASQNNETKVFELINEFRGQELMFENFMNQLLEALLKQKF